MLKDLKKINFRIQSDHEFSKTIASVFLRISGSINQLMWQNQVS